ncbi:actin-like ATPase domain-containing protein [Patellaria atrata CBS 101060]|uniref:Actin-like ATPase domain-containing protein n=1 Tax=Patellaria atrata CBS 101060 TaxID=1346257 RepID=A0A9P4VVA3_9PEZI|nr:actin-like ATPase domain-containing protein [Patellaria atrata CBS 101060]
MVGKRSGKAQMREEGLEKTDNNLDITTWPVVNMINQKNYYTEYLKRDDQILALRSQNEESRNRMVREARDRDRALAQTSNNGATLPDPDVEMNDDTIPEEATGGMGMQEVLGSKVVVIHPGSQYLRIGLASDALPKTVPMCVAHKSRENESEGESVEPKPKRLKIDGEVPEDPDQWFGDDFYDLFGRMGSELTTRMRLNKRRVLPNQRHPASSFNRKSSPDIITEHNDTDRVDWTEIPPFSRKAPEYFTGNAALRIPDKSNPRYKLFWPIQHGWLNEKDYSSKNALFRDITLILEDAIKSQLDLPRKKDWNQFGCVFVIPDLYDRIYVTSMLDMLIRDFGFGRVCFIQESLAASFGAGVASACIVDVGAQKTSICCVDEGMCIESSRINLKYGGADVTEALFKMMLIDQFPYSDINLNRRYDFLLAEERKHETLTMNDADVIVRQWSFYLRVAGQDTRRYQYKTYDEPMIAPMGFFEPDLFDISSKLEGRRKLIDKGYDLYDGSPSDPISNAQIDVLEWAQRKYAEKNGDTNGVTNTTTITATPARQQPYNLLNRLNDIEGTPRSSVAGSPGPEGTPNPARDSPAVGGAEASDIPLYDPVAEKIKLAEERDHILPIMPLELAILRSISHGSKNDEKKFRDFVGGIMVIGGGAKMLNPTVTNPKNMNTASFNTFLEIKLREAQPDLKADAVLAAMPPRDLDGQVVVWKGASIYGKLSSSGNDSWIGQKEYDMHGARLLAYKVTWSW